MKTTRTLLLLLTAFALVASFGCDDMPADGDGDGDADGDGDGDACEGCLVDSVCHEAGAGLAGNPCVICDPDRSESSWSDNDGVACDDEQHCNGEDTCGGGTCSVHTGDPCSDDGIFCNGAELCDDVIDDCVHRDAPCGDDGLFCNGEESCDEEGDQCVSSGNPCEGDCNDAVGGCCEPRAYVACNDDGDRASYDSCANEERVVERCDHSERGVCVEGTCGCIPGWTGTGCDECVIYVSASTGSDDDDGGTWESALATVQAGIDRAAESGCPRVWVATGTYFPAHSHPSDPDPREAAIQLAESVRLYGGFAGDEMSLLQRDVSANETILSGDIGVVDDDSDNAYTVVFADHVSHWVLDGFTITGGRADGDDIYGSEEEHERGGGLYASGRSTDSEIASCTFVDNAAELGGGLAVSGSVGLTIRRSTFVENSATDIGGAAFFQYSRSTRVDGCAFIDNDADVGVGGLFLDEWEEESVVTSSYFVGNRVPDDSYYLTISGAMYLGTNAFVIGCTFVDNSAPGTGGVTFRDPGVIRNSVFWGNSALEGTLAEQQLTEAAEVTNSIVQGGYDGEGNLDSDPLFVNIDPDVGPIDLALQPGSPAVDAGSTTSLPLDERDLDGDSYLEEPLPFDVTGAPRIMGEIVDMGAYEQEAPPTCGNLGVEEDETCDDGNAEGGDGCSSSCEWEPGSGLTPSIAAASCADIAAAYPGLEDGTYWLLAEGLPSQPFQAWCHDMAGSPATYLQLVLTGGGYNYSQYTVDGSGPDTNVVTHYYRIRLDPATLQVDTAFFDHPEFSVTTGSAHQGDTPVTSMAYARAEACIGPENDAGRGQIDLQGTPFRVAADAFVVDGWLPAGTTTYGPDGRYVDLTGGGHCGGNHAIDGILQLEYLPE